jgi:hypothetical protein
MSHNSTSERLDFNSSLLTKTISLEKSKNAKDSNNEVSGTINPHLSPGFNLKSSEPMIISHRGSEAIGKQLSDKTLTLDQTSTSNLLAQTSLMIELD